MQSMVKTVTTYIVVVLIFLFALVIGGSLAFVIADRATTNHLESYTEDVPKPVPSATPEAMKDQCRGQPDIVYCQTLCADRLLKPSWCM